MKEKFNLVELALNGKEAMKHFFFANLWFLIGALCLVGVAVVIVAMVVLFTAVSCAPSAEGMVCALHIISPIFN